MAKRDRVTGTEQCYTPPGVAATCMVALAPYLRPSDVFLEPAGGTGAFIEAIRAQGVSDDRIISYDIDPKHSLVQKTDDFLKQELTGQNLVTVSNPPFGRNNSLSVPFFNRAASVSRIVAFIVPKSWRKWSVQDRLDQNFHLVHDAEISVIYVDDKGVQLHDNNKLKTVFQIWGRRPTKRKLMIPSVKDHGFIEKTTPQDADVSLTVFGRGCGSVKTEFKRVKNTTQMFLKVKDQSVVDALKQLDLSRFYNNTAYIEALSITEINYALNEWFKV